MLPKGSKILSKSIPDRSQIAFRYEVAFRINFLSIFDRLVDGFVMDSVLFFVTLFRFFVDKKPSTSIVKNTKTAAEGYQKLQKSYVDER